MKTLVLCIGLFACVASALDVQKYGVTFESAANGVSNDFAYATGGNMVGGYWSWDEAREGYYWHPNDYSYNGVADGEPYGWFVGSEDDESKIIMRTDAAGGQALQLDTESFILTNKLQKSVADEINGAIAGGGGAYMELDAKFVANDTPDAGIEGGWSVYSSTKSVRSALRSSWEYERWWPPLVFVPRSSTSPLFAIYAYLEENDEYYNGSYHYSSTTNLVAFHGVMDADGRISYTNEVFDVPVDTETYTNLRIEMRQFEDPVNHGARYNVFSIRVGDGPAISSATALDARFGGTATGTWFMTVEARGVQADKLLSSLNFKGCGEIDNVKVGVIEGMSPTPYDPSPENPVGGTLCDPAGCAITDAEVLDWIARYGATQSDIDALTLDKFNEAFLLNLDLTKECLAELKITSVEIEDGTVTLGVSLSRSEDGSAVGLRAINGRVRLLGRENLSSGTFSVLDADVGNGDFGDGNTSGIEYELPDSTPPTFFKVVVE